VLQQLISTSLSFLIYKIGEVWWLMSIITVPGRLRKQDYDFEVKPQQVIDQLRLSRETLPHK
jgi:hypothetical protein